MEMDWHWSNDMMEIKVTINSYKIHFGCDWIKNLVRKIKNKLEKLEDFGIVRFLNFFPLSNS